MRRPIEIIGGGLAGLSLGLGLRRAGVPVVLYEAGSYPRHRVCGEFITGLKPSTVARLGLGEILSDASVHRSVAWFVRERPGRLQRLPAPALGLSRYALDARIASAFSAAGGELHTGSRAASAVGRAGRVVATGRRRGGSAWLGLKLHARSLELAADLELHLGDGGYLGLSGIEDGQVNACGFFRRRALAAPGPELLLAYLRACGLAQVASRLGRAAIDPRSICAVAALAADPRVPRSAELRLGDACAMIPPFTGDGMAMAFQGAEIALDPLIAYSNDECAWESAVRAVQDGLRRSFRVRLASAGALHPFLHRPRPQRWLAALNGAGLVPLRPLYALLH